MNVLLDCLFVIVPRVGLLIWVWRHLPLYYCNGNFRFTLVLELVIVALSIMICSDFPYVIHTCTMPTCLYIYLTICYVHTRFFVTGHLCQFGTKKSNLHTRIATESSSHWRLTGYTESCHFDNFQCNQWWQIGQTFGLTNYKQFSVQPVITNFHISEQKL